MNKNHAVGNVDGLLTIRQKETALLNVLAGQFGQLAVTFLEFWLKPTVQNAVMSIQPFLRHDPFHRLLTVKISLFVIGEKVKKEKTYFHKAIKSQISFTNLCISSALALSKPLVMPPRPPP